MKILSTILFLVCLSISAQNQLTLRSPFYAAALRAPAVAPGGYDPTTVATLKSWYKRGTYYTNGTTATWPDQKSGYHLTNGAGTTCPVGTNDGTRSSIFFDGSNDYLRCDTYTNAQPHEIWLALMYEGALNSTTFIIDSINSSFRNAVILNGSGNYDLYAGTDTGVGNGIQNLYITICCVFDGNSNHSSVITNGILAGVVSPGTQTISGLTLGSRYNQQYPAKMHICEMLTYSATNSGAVRTNIQTFLWQNNLTYTNSP